MAKRKEELQFDCHGDVSLDDILDSREPPIVDYEPPTEGKWRALFAVTFLQWTGSAKAAMGCLIAHANPKTGRCDPGHARMARLLGLQIRVIERAMTFLKTTPFLSWERRGGSSNAYHINWDALDGVFQAYLRNAKRTDPNVGLDAGDDIATFHGNSEATRSKRREQPDPNVGSNPIQTSDKTVKRNSKGNKKHEVVRLAEEANLTCMFEDSKKTATKEEVVAKPPTPPTHSLQAPTADDPYTVLMADLLERGERAAVEWVCGADAVYHAAIDAEVLNRGAGALLVLEEYRKYLKEADAA